MQNSVDKASDSELIALEVMATIEIVESEDSINCQTTFQCDDESVTVNTIASSLPIRAGAFVDMKNGHISVL